jgi:hypothetical protein
MPSILAERPAVDKGIFSIQGNPGAALLGIVPYMRFDRRPRPRWAHDASMRSQRHAPGIEFTDEIPQRIERVIVAID